MSKQWGHGFNTGHERGEEIGKLLGAGAREAEFTPILFRIGAIVHGAYCFANSRDASSQCVSWHAIHTYEAILELLGGKDVVCGMTRWPEEDSDVIAGTRAA